MKIRKLQLAARFALCKFFHDSGILFVELIQQADDQNADKDQQRAKHIDVDDRVDCGLRLHNSAAGRGNIAAQTHNACNACLCDAGAQLGADRTACEDEALLTDVVLPLAKLDNVTDHAEYKGTQRCFTDAAQHGGEQAPAEAGGVEEEQPLTDQYKNGACYDHVALAEHIAQQRTQEGEYDQNDGFGKIQRAVHPRVVMEHILAVVRQNRADNSLIGALEHPEQQDSPEILIGDQRLEAAADRNLFLRAGCDVYGFLALDKAGDEQQESDCGPDAHYLDPGSLIVAEQLDQRHGAGDGNDTAHRGQAHAEYGQQIALLGVAGHHGRQRAVRQIDRRVADGRAEVIGDKDVQELDHGVGVRYAEQQDRTQRIRQRHPQDPRTGLSPFGMGAVHNEAHDNIRAAVKETRDQHDKTYGCDGNTGIVGIEQGQQRGDHAVDNVARYVTAAVSQACQNIDFSVFGNWLCRQNRLCLHGWIGFHETFSPSWFRFQFTAAPIKCI